MCEVYLTEAPPSGQSVEIQERLLRKEEMHATHVVKAEHDGSGCVKRGPFRHT